MACRAAKVDQREVKLLRILMTRVPRPTICLNSVIEPTARSSNDQATGLRIQRQSIAVATS